MAKKKYKCGAKMKYQNGLASNIANAGAAGLDTAGDILGLYSSTMNDEKAGKMSMISKNLSSIGKDLSTQLPKANKSLTIKAKRGIKVKAKVKKKD